MAKVKNKCQILLNSLYLSYKLFFLHNQNLELAHPQSGSLST